MMRRCCAAAPPPFLRTWCQRACIGWISCRSTPTARSIEMLLSKTSIGWRLPAVPSIAAEPAVPEDRMEKSIMNDTDREIRSFVRSFVAQRSLVPSNEISDELDFFEAGLLDSI